MNKIDTVSKVLRLKEHRKEEIEHEVRNVTDMINLIRKEIDSLEQRFSEATMLFNEKQNKGDVGINELGLFYNYFHQLNDEMTASKKEMAEKLAELDHRREELLEAYKEKKIMEILKGKIEQEDKREKEQSAQKEMDFLFLAKRKKQ